MHAAAPLMSQTPSPYALSFFIIKSCGFDSHPSPAGTVSKWTLTRYFGEPLVKKILIKDHKSKIPSDFNDLTNLPGVGNKTASVYQNEILDIPRIAVDTHVYRVSNRVGLAKTKTADQTQEILEQITPKKWLKTAHHLLILHGRYTCKSQKPMCDQCVITKHCLYLKNEKN